ncbi:MAG: preprotein translocase subunit SecY [Planctomycetota bacterium]
MLKQLLNLFRDQEMKKRIWITLGLLVVYRLGSALPLPGARPEAVKEFFSPLLGVVDIVSGGALGRLSVFALGIMPYITATIILQLLQGVIPHLEQLSKEGAKGYEKIRFYHRLGTIAICLFQGTVYYKWLLGGGAMPSGIGFYFLTMMTLTTGAMFLMWLGDQITEYGVGNGVSLIIMAGIVSRLPQAVHFVGSNMTWRLTESGGLNPLTVGALLVVFVVVVVGVVFITQGQRRIPMQQAKITRGTRVLGGQRTYLPLRVNHASVMPIIFGSSLLIFPAYFFRTISGITQGASFWETMVKWFQAGGFLYVLCYVPLIFFFCYFWTSLTFKPKELSDDLKQYGSFIPGIRPGRKTADYLEGVMVRITFAGAAFLTAIALLPQLVGRAFNIGGRYEVIQYFGGTSILIVVGVGLDLMERLESQMIQKHYGGFLGAKGGRIRGRR